MHFAVKEAQLSCAWCWGAVFDEVHFSDGIAHAAFMCKAGLLLRGLIQVSIIRKPYSLP